MHILTVLFYQNYRSVFATLDFASSAGYSEMIFYELHIIDTLLTHLYEIYIDI